MLRCFIFDELEDSWIEENSRILKHDLSALLDDDKMIIYLWKGPKSTKERYRKALEMIDHISKRNLNTPIELVKDEKRFPLEVKEKFANLLKTKSEEEDGVEYSFSRFFTIRAYLILLIITITLPLISVLNLISFFSWNKIGTNYLILSGPYNNWLNLSIILIIITTVSFALTILIGIYEQEQQVITLSSIGIIICIGLLIYLHQRIFIFEFQEGSTISSYLIRNEDLILFILLILISKSIFLIPNIIKLASFLKTYRKFIV